MTLAQHWTILVKHYKLIVIFTLLAGLGALGGSKLMTPLYQATVLVQIAIPSGNNQTDYNSLLASDQLVQTEAILATSDPVLREVASHYPGLSADQLVRAVTATPKLNTQLFEIDVLDANPSRAAMLANDIATTLIQQQLRMMQQQRAQADNFFLIAQPAQPALSPARPNTLLNTGTGLLMGLLLGILLAILLEQLDTHVRTPEELKQLLDWPLLTTIWKADGSSGVIDPKKPHGNLESYRILRTNVGFSGIDKPMRSFVVTSGSPNEGKSTVAANLAIFMARAGKKTLLIDADLRHPTVHEIFHLPADKKGLSNAILACSTPTAIDIASHRQSLPDALLSLSSVSKLNKTSLLSVAGNRTLLEPSIHAVDVPNLFVMPSGPLPPNSSELLDSKAMQRFFIALANCGAEVVIFDTPPLLGLSDTSILTSKVDGTLVVVDITRAKRGRLRQVQTVLAQSGAHVLGCIVNKQDRSRSDILYPFYYGADAHDGTDNHNAKTIEHAAPSPATPHVSTKAVVQPHQAHSIKS